MAADARRRLDRRAMGTTLSVYGPSRGFDAGAAAIMRTFEKLEMRFSRFRDDSELTRVNGRAGRWTSVSSDFLALLRCSLEAAASTGGTFDPTVIRAMESAGYDVDLDEVLRTARGVLGPPVPCGRWNEIEVRGNEVRLPIDVGLDFGAVAKGWAADVAVQRALDAGMAWVLVSSGGDCRLGGRAPELEIDVEDPDTTGLPIATLRLQRGALATSSTVKRTWGPGLHHVIDPATGRPAVTDARQATTWAPTGAEAEVAATTMLLRGTRSVADAPSVIVGVDGTVHVSMKHQRRMAA
jgi:thiamine biosynthesis lipoprotein